MKPWVMNTWPSTCRSSADDRVGPGTRAARTCRRACHRWPGSGPGGPVPSRFFNRIIIPLLHQALPSYQLFGGGPDVVVHLLNTACHPLSHVLVKGALLLLRLLHWHVFGDAIPACLPVTNACVTTRALDGQEFCAHLLEDGMTSPEGRVDVGLVMRGLGPASNRLDPILCCGVGQMS